MSPSSSSGQQQQSDVSKKVKEVGFAAVGSSTWTYFSSRMFGAYLQEIHKRKKKMSMLK
jgi:hypothetical protein